MLEHVPVVWIQILRRQYETKNVYHGIIEFKFFANPAHWGKDELNGNNTV